VTSSRVSGDTFTSSRPPGPCGSVRPEQAAHSNSPALQSVARFRGAPCGRRERTYGAPPCSRRCRSGNGSIMAALDSGDAEVTQQRVARMSDAPATPGRGSRRGRPVTFVIHALGSRAPTVTRSPIRRLKDARRGRRRFFSDVSRALALDLGRAEHSATQGRPAYRNGAVENAGAAQPQLRVPVKSRV